jgi:hypothetical protein
MFRVCPSLEIERIKCLPIVAEGHAMACPYVAAAVIKLLADVRKYLLRSILLGKTPPDGLSWLARE